MLSQPPQAASMLKCVKAALTCTKNINDKFGYASLLIIRAMVSSKSLIIFSNAYH